MRTAGHLTGWVLKRFVDDPAPPEPPHPEGILGAVAAPAAVASTHTCDDGTVQPFYRWNVKVGATEHAPPRATTVSQMRTQWALPDGIGHSAASFCAPADPDEGATFALTGYVSRIMKSETDQDWHVKIVASKSATKESCVVVEIPDPQFGQQFQAARDALDQVVGTNFDKKTGYVTPKVRVRVVGAAFYDGTHVGSGALMNNHGNCNAGRGALWELHPVFAIAAAP